MIAYYIWKTLNVYAPSQKFNTISVLRDTIEIWKKLTILKKSNTSILHYFYKHIINKLQKNFSYIIRWPTHFIITNEFNNF